MKHTNKHRLLVREQLGGKPAFSCYSHEEGGHHAQGEIDCLRSKVERRY